MSRKADDEIAELADTVRDLTEDIGARRMAIDELRDEFVWGSRNGCLATDEQTPPARPRSMASGPAPADWAEVLADEGQDEQVPPSTEPEHPLPRGKQRHLW